MGNDGRCNFVNCEQGTDEWLRSRLGKVTASKFKDVMTNGRGKAASKTAESYMMELIAEKLAQSPVNTFSNPAMQHGNDNEPEARSVYSWRTGSPVETVGFATHIEHEDVGASSDGLVGDDGCVEIKCPYNPVNHLHTLSSQCFPKQYEWQVQGQLWVLQRKWCDFVSFDPRMPETHRLVVIRVERDEELIEALSARVLLFVDAMKKKEREIEAAAMEMAYSSASWEEIEQVGEEIANDEGI